jgi:NADPH-dependent glutamate synthase beta subunit-like oxidoreductase
MAHPGQFVAIFGGAVSGAEAAYQLSRRGIHSVVFEQNDLPYGKIEDGLPKWHIKLRDREITRIDEKLGSPLVQYVPGVRLGREITFKEIVEDWGFSAILLAIGAWRDRPLPVDGIDQFVGNGFHYQNPFMYWFNHKHEPAYKGPQYEIKDDAIVIGGGLASLDVVKVIMIESVQKALEARGISTNLFELDRSIARVLENHNLTLDDLGIKGPTLYYRRRIKDMPLSPFPPDTPEKLEKAEAIREKIISNFQKKYLFHVRALHVATDKIVENGELKGLIFQQTKIQNGKAVVVPGSQHEHRSEMIISSIGSIPEHINGIPLDGQVIKVANKETCQLEGYPHVFAIGNAVTGRGNIEESVRHGRDISQAVVHEYLTNREEMYEESFRTTESGVKQKIATLADNLQTSPKLPAERMTVLMDRIKQLQRQVGYGGDYAKWIKNHLPPRLEKMIGYGH